MREPREFDLQWEGRRCIVQELGSLQARQVARRIANVIGAAVKEGAQGALDRDVNVAGLMATGAVLERLDDATLEWLTQTFVKVTSVEAEPGGESWMSPRDVSELVFGGGEGLARWFRWLKFCLEMTCADFFRAAFAEITQLQKRSSSTGKANASPENAASPSPNTSPRTGTFTA